MTDDEINALAREIADCFAWTHLCYLGSPMDDIEDNPSIDLLSLPSDPEALHWLCKEYLDARGLLERPDPANPNIVRRKEQHD